VQRSSSKQSLGPLISQDVENVRFVPIKIISSDCSTRSGISVTAERFNQFATGSMII
jgi:hypothetical protein